LNILVTGGAGMIGSNLVKRLVSEGHSVKVADNLWRGKLENLFDGDRPAVDLDTEFYRVDLRRSANCLAVSRDVDVVYHLADIVAGINYVFSNEFPLFRANILMNSHMLNAAVENGVKKYVYVGTACSYPKEKQASLHPPPFREEDAYPADPESSYGWSKLMGEYECGLAQRAGDIEIGLLRLHNVYGPPCELSPEKSQVIPALCRKAIRHPAEDFVVWGSGRQRRAFVYVDDVTDALCRVLTRGMNQGVIQIGPGESESIGNIARRIVELSGKPLEIAFDTTKPEGDVDRTADWSKASRILGWSPRVNIADGLERTYEWCRRHLEAESKHAGAPV